ncbi:MAG: polysaccharide biosynthesis protein, partial [uncultured bacterium]
TTKNTLFMTMASIFQKVIAFAYFTLIARNIGATGTGTYFFALSFTTVFVVFVDLGLTNVFIRESAKAKEKLGEYLSTILSIKIWLGILSYLAAVIVINLMGYDMETRHLVYLSAVTMLLDSLHLTLYGSLRALGELKYESMSIVGSQLLTLILGTFFLYAGFPLIYLIFAFTVSSVGNVFFAIFILKTKHHLSLKPHFQSAIAKRIAIIAIPFALAAVFARVYSYIDSILLSKMIGNEAVGFYSIPYKITYAFQFIPLALIASLYPKFSEYFAHDKKKLSQVFEQGMKYLLLISMPIAFGIAVLSKDIVLFLYTDEYLPSVLPLQILIISLIFSYLSFPIGAFLNACDKQKIQTAIVGAVMALNIVLNLLLIPLYGVSGAAISALVGNVLLTVLGYLIVPQITHVSHGFIAKTFVQILFAALGMALAVYLVNTQVNFFYAILVGAVTYPILLFVTRSVNMKELKEALLFIKR